MKYRTILLFTIVLTFLSGMSAVLAGPDRHPFHRDNKNIKERIVTLRNWKLMEEFNLNGDRANRVFNILKKFDDQRAELIVKRRKFYRSLKDKLHAEGLPEKELRDIVDEIGKLNIELSKLPQEEVKALSSVFSVREQAEYILFSEKFAREARKLIMGSLLQGKDADSTKWKGKQFSH